MIIIANHNNKDNLNRILDSIQEHGHPLQDIGVVYSGSESYCLETKIVCGERGIKSVEGDNTFETGAWRKAYTTWEAPRYLFLQDSMEVTSVNFYSQFKDRCNATTAVAWCTFTPYLLGVTPEVRDRILTEFGIWRAPTFGIFGSMFMADARTLRRVLASGYWDNVPRDKVGSEAWERWWALVFNRLDIVVDAIHEDGFMFLHRGGHYTDMRKHFSVTPGVARGV